MKLSIYLVRESVTEFDEVLQPKYLEGAEAFIELQPTGPLPYPCKAFVQKNKAKPPRWLPFLSSHFDTANLGLLNRSNSFVLLIRAANRIFAVTFGHGFQAIDRAKIEPRFGLMVAASSLNPDQIRTLETNVIDTVTRNKRTHVSTGSRVSEFDLNPHIDWVRKLSGKPNSSKLANFVSGSDSVCIGVDCELNAVAAKCGELLSVFESDAYKDAFKYLDHLRPLGKQEPNIAGLEVQLAARLASKSHDRISIAFPELPDEELLDYYKVTGARSGAELPELSLEGVYDFVTEREIDSDPAHIFIVGIGGHGEAVTKRRSLREYLVCEIDQEGETFIFCLGHWFRAERDYVQKIRDEVAELADVSDALDLLPIRNGEPEGDYNHRLADERQWALMDKQNFHAGSSYDKVEVCDILTVDRQLVCVKKMERSSSLSHLFAQGSVSATLLRESEDYRETINQTAVAHWPGQSTSIGRDLGSVTVVYAIATRKTGTLASSMFFFSLVNLLNHVRAIRRVGCNVALCRIGYEESPPKPRASKRPQKAEPASLARIDSLPPDAALQGTVEV